MLIVAVKVCFTAMLLSPACQLNYLLTCGNHPWVRWSILAYSIVCLASMSFFFLGTSCLFVLAMPRSLAGATLQVASLAGFITAGMLWFNRGCFDVRSNLRDRAN